MSENDFLKSDKFKRFAYIFAGISFAFLAFVYWAGSQVNDTPINGNLPTSVAKKVIKIDNCSQDPATRATEERLNAQMGLGLDLETEPESGNVIVRLPWCDGIELTILDEQDTPRGPWSKVEYQSENGPVVGWVKNVQISKF